MNFFQVYKAEFDEAEDGFLLTICLEKPGVKPGSAKIKKAVVATTAAKNFASKKPAPKKPEVKKPEVKKKPEPKKPKPEPKEVKEDPYFITEEYEVQFFYCFNKIILHFTFEVQTENLKRNLSCTVIHSSFQMVYYQDF